MTQLERRPQKKNEDDLKKNEDDLNKNEDNLKKNHRSGRFYSDFRQDMTNLWMWGTYTSLKTTEEQPVSKDACVSKEGWNINHFKMKFVSQIY